MAADSELPELQPPTPGPAVRGVDWAILMARAQVGDSSSYRRLLGEISPYLRSLAAASHRDPLDIEDTVQDVLLSIHSVRHTYDPARPFGPWLVAIARRRIVDRLRAQGRRMSRESPMSQEHETFASPSANYGAESVDAQAVRDAVGRLPAGQRDAIRLIKLQEMTLREASSVTGLSVAALKVATHRGLKTLRKLMVKSDAERP
ncbi:MAG: sigma-70 family RNA polymerase sigma factor [Caldimonas sp.]